MRVYYWPGITQDLCIMDESGRVVGLGGYYSSARIPVDRRGGVFSEISCHVDSALIDDRLFEELYWGIRRLNKCGGLALESYISVIEKITLRCLRDSLRKDAALENCLSN